MKRCLFSGPYATTRRGQPSANLTPARPVGGTGGTAECACRAAGRWCKTCWRACRGRKAAAVCFDFSFLVGIGIVVGYYINMNVFLKHARMMQRQKALRCAKICIVQDSSGNGDIEKIIMENIQKELQCPICFEYLENPVITECKHIFCQSCINNQLWHTLNPTCPKCRRPLQIHEESEKLCRRTLLKKIAIEVNAVNEISHHNDLQGKPLLSHYFEELFKLQKKSNPNDQNMLDKCKQMFLTRCDDQDVFDKVILHTQNDNERIRFMFSNFLKFFEYVKHVHQKQQNFNNWRFDFAVNWSNSHRLRLGKKVKFNRQDYFFVDDLTDNAYSGLLSIDSFDRPLALEKNDIVCMHSHRNCIGKVLSSVVKSENGEDVEMYRVYFPSLITEPIHLCRRSDLTFCFPGLRIQLDSTEISL